MPSECCCTPTESGSYATCGTESCGSVYDGEYFSGLKSGRGPAVGLTMVQRPAKRDRAPHTSGQLYGVCFFQKMRCVVSLTYVVLYLVTDWCCDRFRQNDLPVEWGHLQGRLAGGPHSRARCEELPAAGYGLRRSMGQLTGVYFRSMSVV